MAGRINWDAQLEKSGVPAVMFNDNGVWFGFTKIISLEHTRTLIRELAKIVPIETAKIRPASSLPDGKIDYSIGIYAQKGYVPEILLRKNEDTAEIAGLFSMPSDEMAALVANPSQLLKNHWDGTDQNDRHYRIAMRWHDGGRHPEPIPAALCHIGECIASGVVGGIYKHEEAGTIRIFEWAAAKASEPMIVPLNCDVFFMYC